MSTPDLFPNTKPPRARPRVLMHVSDAGDSGCSAEDGRVYPMCKLTCRRCGHESAWLVFDTLTEAKRGIACPECNPQSAATAQMAEFIESNDP